MITVGIHLAEGIAEANLLGMMGDGKEETSIVWVDVLMSVRVDTLVSSGTS